MKSFITDITVWAGHYGWLVEFSISLTATIVALFLWARLCRFLNLRSQQTTKLWDDIVVRAISTPVSILILILGVQQLIAIVSTIFTDYQHIARLFATVRSVAVAVTLFWTLLRLISSLESHYRSNTLRIGDKQLQPGAIYAVSRVLRAILAFIALLTVMDAFGVSISGLLAFGGIGGIAIGFAAKDTLANFFSGMVIFWERPFVIGDWIRCPDSNIEGVVEKIGWRMTQLRTFDQRPLYVPNSLFSSQVIENPQRMNNRRIYEYMGVRYDDIAKLSAILEDTRAMLRAHSDIDQSKILIVAFDRYGASSLDFFVYAMTHTTVWADFHSVKENVLLKIAAIVQKHGAEFAFPTRTVHHVDGDGAPPPIPLGAHPSTG